MRIVITGASGLLGRALMQCIAKVDAEIEVIGLSRQDIPGLLRLDHYRDAPDGDVLVHLAEASDRRQAEAGGELYEQTAKLTLSHLLQKNFQHIVYASSAALYGDQHLELRCVGDPLHIVDAYTRIKHASEQEILHRGGIIARLTNIYGPGMSGQNVLSAILRQHEQPDAIRVFDLQPVRDFIWVEDAAAVLAKMCLSKGNGIYNVGTGCGASVRDLVNIVLDCLGQTGRPIEAVQPSIKQSHLVVDIASTEAKFGWLPTTSLRDGIGSLTQNLR